MRLTDIWNALVAGDVDVLDQAYLHRAMRERGPALIKGREDIAADWNLLLNGAEIYSIVDLGDMAMIQWGETVWHHWVRREEDQIGYEILIPKRDFPREPAIIERVVENSCGRAELFHIFFDNGMRQIGSWVEDSDGRSMTALSDPIPNG